MALKDYAFTGKRLYIRQPLGVAIDRIVQVDEPPEGPCRSYVVMESGGICQHITLKLIKPRVDPETPVMYLTIRKTPDLEDAQILSHLQHLLSYRQ